MQDSPAPDTNASRPLLGAGHFIALLVLTALAVRFVSALRVQVIATDGVRYIGLAKLWAGAEFGRALADDYHPLFPILIALVRPLVGGFETASFAVPLLFSSLTVLPLYGFVRALFSRQAALLASFVFAVLPPFVRCGADTLSEGPFHFFLVLALYLGLRGFRQRNPALPLLCGLAISCAYLTRPEGIGMLASFGALTGLLIVVGTGKKSRLGVALAGLLILAGFLLPALPYLVHIRAETGRWDLSRKKTASDFVESVNEKQKKAGGETLPGVEIVSLPHALARVGRGIVGNLYFIPALFALAGLLFPWRKGDARPWRWEFLLLFASGVWVAACLFLLRSHGYLSHRHTMPVALFLLGHVGRGSVLLAELAGPHVEKLGFFGRLRPRLSGAGALLALLAIVALLAGITENIKPYRKDKVFVKDVGRYLAASGLPEGAVLGNLPRASHYASRVHVPLPFGVRPGDLAPFARQTGAAVLVLEEFQLRGWSRPLLYAVTDGGLPPDWILVKIELPSSPSGGRVWAYRLRE